MKSPSSRPSSRSASRGVRHQKSSSVAEPKPLREIWFTPMLWVPLVTMLCVVYIPAIRGEFIWDDDGHITRPDLRSVEGLGRIWFNVGVTAQYYPLLHSGFWVQHSLWGDEP